MDCLTCGLGLYSPECINSHIRTLALLGANWVKNRYEEELIIEFADDKSSTVREYVNLVRQIESLMNNPGIYGLAHDENYPRRKKLIRTVYEYLSMDPLLAVKTIQDYAEKPPLKPVYMEAYKTFRDWVNGILKGLTECKMYSQVQQLGDLRQVFISFAGLQTILFIKSFKLPFPENAREIPLPESAYTLPYGVNVKIYSLEGAEANLYHITNPLIDSLSPELELMLKEAIMQEMHILSPEKTDYRTVFDDKVIELRQMFMERSLEKNIVLNDELALALARECASWSVGVGSPLENMALDKENVTDIYVDGENTPLYIEHARFGLCHTLMRYNRDLLDDSFRNIVSLTHPLRKFDSQNPVLDVQITRLGMRAHLQREPATFGPLQGSFRLFRESPFTYPEYLLCDSFSPFYAGYDDVMTRLGCSVGVMGLKGTGKTSFTAAKILAIGTSKRIIPVQDIEEIPVTAYRKRGFHIASVRVQSSDVEGATTQEVDLVAMANALLRVGEACLIINEVRSRTAVQGVLNILNTQPGVFLLYNLHAQSLHDVRDRVELVFGMPASSLFATDRFSFIQKISFGRAGLNYRVIENEFETDQTEHKFVEIFQFEHKDAMENSQLKCSFLRNPEASARDLSKVNTSSLAKSLDFNYVPPALERRAKRTGTPVNEYVLEAFFKGRMYQEITTASEKLNNPYLRGMDFVLKCNSFVNNKLKEYENDHAVDYRTLEKEWAEVFRQMLAEETKNFQSAAKSAEKPGK